MTEPQPGRDAYSMSFPKDENGVTWVRIDYTTFIEPIDDYTDADYLVWLDLFMTQLELFKRVKKATTKSEFHTLAVLTMANAERMAMLRRIYEL